MSTREKLLEKTADILERLAEKCGGRGGTPGPCPGGGAGKPASGGGGGKPLSSSAGVPKPKGDSNEIDSVLTKMDSVGRTKTASYKKKLGLSDSISHKGAVESLIKQGFEHTALVSKKDSRGKATSTTAVLRKKDVAVLVTEWAHTTKTDIQFFEARKPGTPAAGTSGGSRNNL